MGNIDEEAHIHVVDALLILAFPSRLFGLRTVLPVTDEKVRDSRQEHQREERIDQPFHPQRHPPWRRHDNVDGIFSKDSGVVRVPSPHTETVLAGGKVGIECVAVVAGINPFILKSFKTVTEIS